MDTPARVVPHSKKKAPARPRSKPIVCTDADLRMLDRLTGGSARSLKEGLAQWENEQIALSELHDDNQALRIIQAKVLLIYKRVPPALERIEQDAGLFLSQKARDLLQGLREEIADLETQITLGKQITKNK